MNTNIYKVEAAPELTVVMLVYNGEKYLREAIDSVLNQSYNDFELLMINDGSVDDSLNIIMSYTDPRIIIINNEKNQGIPYSRNLGLTKARGEFLAWIDCDDVILPSRFEKQVSFLKENLEYGVCGSWIERFGGGERNYITKTKKDPEFLRTMLLFKPSLPNGTIMLRLSTIKEHNILFNNNLSIAEDYDFLLKCSMFCSLTVVPEVLYKYRASETSISKKFESQETRSFDIHKTIYSKALLQLGIHQPSEENFSTHMRVSSEKPIRSYLEFNACYEWLKYLKHKNQEIKNFDEKMFRKVLADRFFFMCKKSSSLGLVVLWNYLIRAGASFEYVGLYDVFKLSIRCLIRYKRF